MKRRLCCIMAFMLSLGFALHARAETLVKMRGDSFIMGNFYVNHNYTGWNKTGTKTEDTFEVWERFRLRADFEASKAVYFRLGLRVINTWGQGTYTAANPAAEVLVDLAYLQFRVPDTKVEVTAGLQVLDLPQAAIFNGSVLYSDTVAALTVNAPIIPDAFSVLAGFGRLFDTNRTFDTTTTQQGDELDAYFLALPITVEGMKATPWGVVAVAGRSANYTFKNTADVSEIGNSFDNALFSAASVANMNASSGLGRWKNAQNPYVWAGGSFDVSALDPIRFYADVIYGEGAMNDSSAAKRHGWMVDFAMKYTGWSVATPELYAFWSTGEDNSTRNGSERMPYMRSQWGPGRSFLFESGQDLPRDTTTYTTPVGIYGMAFSLANISFVEKLSNRLTFAYVHGNNSPRAIRAARLLNASYMTMGHDLAQNDYLTGLNLDTKYDLYENLALILQTGWAHGQFQESVWGHRLVSQAEANGNNTWLLALGLSYKF
ncbi:outer membrane homotrimeric porin [Solidesulfovibrio sp.]|uniref:outer membrane homotrimeric porin n=1 Tax=Solidesulfovibrio sp. TaxID=2910990 RepID=UPI002606F5FC|nr:outer membrane homotrimeric porin [Solidesulfovibrio sp.]